MMNKRKVEEQVVYGPIDSNILELINQHGKDCYGVYLQLECKLFKEKVNSLDIERSLSDELNISFEKLKSIIMDFGLFHVHYGRFSSDNIHEYDSKGMLQPDISWYDHGNISHGKRFNKVIIEDLNTNEELTQLILDWKDEFIVFASTRRVEKGYANIEEEVNIFLSLIEDGLE